MASLFARLKAGLAKTAQQIRDRLGDATGATTAPETTRTSVDIDRVEAMEDALIAADVGLPATVKILDLVRADTDGSMRERVTRIIKRLLTDVPVAPRRPRARTSCWSLASTARQDDDGGKLAHYYRTSGRSVMVCAAGSFRAAAVEQLAVWTSRAGVDLIRAQSGADPAAVTFDAVTAAKARGREIVIVDTAGRLHTRANLMAELDKIRRVVARAAEGAPHETLLVLDATVGQNGLVQAREFLSASGVTGIVLTKLDGTAKGGIAIAIAFELKLPIRYVGVGEGIDDLLPFDAEAYVEALFTDKW
jgi:fused signal recognition particle receptor